MESRREFLKKAALLSGSAAMINMPDPKVALRLAASNIAAEPGGMKKTIFIITYDENDGYFDHVPPYIFPNLYKENTGKVSQRIDPKLDFATLDQQTNPSTMESSIREASIGLGYLL